MEFKNKYGIEISDELLINYYNNLIGGFYKILPIFENESQEQYKTCVQNFIYEICGGYYLFNDNPYFLKLLNNLESLLEINEHKKVKSIVFNCISILNKLKGVVSNGI